MKDKRDKGEKKYNSVEELAEANAKALDDYTNLISGSAAVLFCASQLKEQEEYVNKVNNVLDHIGVTPEQSPRLVLGGAENLHEISSFLYVLIFASLCLGTECRCSIQ